MARLILVHGAFCSSNVWGSRVVHELEKLGHSLEILDLPSHGRDSTPKADVTLDLYAEFVAAKAMSRPEPAVLIGHSMGGLVITQAADNVLAAGGTIAGLIYVAAALPRNGKAQNDYTSLPEGAGDELAGNLILSDTKPTLATVPVELAPRALFNDLPEQVGLEFGLTLEPQTVRVFFSPVHITDDRPIHRGYILCTNDRAIPPALQRLMASETPGVRVIELDSDHSPFVSHPEEFLAAVRELLPNA
jgi:pimeloyl-ACP methyl ester carboxylesterase